MSTYKKAGRMSASLTLLVASLSSIMCSLPAHSDDEPDDKPSKSSIYKCMKGGRVTYSDTACETATDKHKVVVKNSNGYAPEPVAEDYEEQNRVREQASESSSNDQGSIAQAQIAKRERCKQLTEQIRIGERELQEARGMQGPGIAVTGSQLDNLGKLRSEFKAKGCR